MKKAMYFFVQLALILFCVSCSLSERHDTFENIETLEVGYSTNVVCSAPIIDAVNGIPDAGVATLKRGNGKISMNFKVEGLTSGYAYTIWWVIWNNPGDCGIPNQCADTDFAVADDVQVEVLYAAGHVVGKSGKGNFSGSLSENDDDGSINDLFGLPGYGGLQDSKNAEVHLVLRSHGPAIPGEVNEQINSYPGGCDFDFPPFTGIPDEEGECGDYMFAIFSPNCGV